VGIALGSVITAWRVFINPCKPTETTYIDSFDGRLWDDCLNRHLFTSFSEAREIVHEQRIDYDTGCTHNSFKCQTPKAIAAARLSIRT